ncbi:MAG: rRNA maturation RNase YbeY [Anaerolineales bacterium]
MIDLQTELSIPSTVQDAILNAVAAVLQHENFHQPADLSIRITDDAELQALNRAFLGIDAPTDVLSFPADEADPETGHPYLGDIAISYPRATQQAAQGGHAVLHELQLLAVHGTLHLLGYDHAEPEDKAHMWQAQQAVLTALGCPLSPP